MPGLPPVPSSGTSVVLGAYEKESKKTVSASIYNSNNNTWESIENIQVPIGTAPVSFFGYIPTSTIFQPNNSANVSQNGDIIALPIKEYSNDNSEFDNLCILTGKDNETTPFYPFANLTMEYAYAMLNIILESSSTSSVELTFQNLSINTGSGNLYPYAHLDLKTDSLFQTEEDKKKYYENGDLKLQNNDNGSYSILVPQTVINDWLYVQLNGVSTNATSSSAPTPKRYTYTIPKEKFTFNPKDGKYYIKRGYVYTIKLDTKYVEEELDAAASNAIMVNGEFGDNYQAYYTTYIAPGNLIATPCTDGSYKYQFAREQGYYTLNRNSEYFCWNSPTPNYEAREGDTYDSTYDPCSKM
ncbi:MAG: fimbrillin family protein [Bacteroides sp.]|nr:fimbrillin family protein [Bacteroides sp.]